MNRKRLLLTGLGLLLLAAGCRTYNVQTDFDPTIEFAGFGRYAFVEPTPVEGANPFADNDLLRKRVRLAIEGELVRRGYRVARSQDKADFLVTYAVMLDDRLQIDGYSSGYAGYYRHRGYGAGYNTTSVRSYQESTLIIDFLDAKSEELLWRGWGTGILGTRDRDRGRERLEDGVQAILDEFPPKPGARD